MGFKKFFEKGWNRFDFVIVFAATVVYLDIAVKGETQEADDVVRFLVLLRTLHVVKVVNGVERYVGGRRAPRTRRKVGTSNRARSALGSRRAGSM